MTKCQNDMADDHDEGGSDESSDLLGAFFFLGRSRVGAGMDDGKCSRENKAKEEEGELLIGLVKC